jgi:anaerobic selenocysteine-containing dehydrogenase
MMLRGKENGAKLIVIDPRFTRTAAHATSTCASAPVPTWR